jgi:hypothetical protein
VFDLRTGCLVLENEEATGRATHRQKLFGLVPPRWLGSGVLSLPVLGTDSVQRLVRPGTDAILWVAMAPEGAGTPSVMDERGSFAGSSTAFESVVGPTPSTQAEAAGLLSAFFQSRRLPLKSCVGGNR